MPISTRYVRPKNKHFKWRDAVIRLALYLVVLPYSILFVYALFFSNGVVFQPPAPSYSTMPGLIALKDRDGNPIAAVYLPNESASQTILYSHGNAEDIGEVYGDLKRLHDLGFAVLAYDYPGYGKSSGRPSEAGVYRAIDAAYAHLTDTLHISPDRILIWGRSVGGGPSVDLASRKKVGGLILESTFVSAFRVLTVWPILPFDTFNNIGKIGNVKCPVLVIHGRRDEVVPFHHGEKLFNAANEPKRFSPIDSAHHNDVLSRGGAGLEKAVQDFARRLNFLNL